MKRKEKNDNNKLDNAMYAKRSAFSGRGRHTDHQQASRRWQQNYTEASGPRGTGREKDGIVCYKCRQVGHIARNCPLNNNQNSKSEQSHNMIQRKNVKDAHLER